MRTPLVVTLAASSERAIARDTLFSLYSLLLRQFIEPIYGWDENFQKQRFAAEYPYENIKLVLADALTAGYVVSVQKPEALHLSLLLLWPEFQSIGIGQKVMHQVISAAKTMGKPVTLSCFKANREALQFYQRLGFVVYQQEPDFVMLTNAIADLVGCTDEMT